MLDKEIAELLEAGMGEPLVLEENLLPAMRDAMNQAGASLPSPWVAVSDHSADGVPVRLYKPHRPPADNLPLLIFFHGGGWMLGGIESHDAPCRMIADRVGCAVLAVAYRLAPEHPFPAGLDDCAKAFAWAAEQADILGYDRERIALGGESAGANLCAALTIRLRDQRRAQPAFQFLVHPATDLTLSQPSIGEVSVPGMTRQYLETCVEWYVGDADAAAPLVSPLCCSDLSDLPRTIIYSAEVDPLRDDGEHYALALARAGNEVLVQRLKGLPHGFMFLPSSLGAVDRAFDVLAASLKTYFGGR
ncbi:alpha/beta hydrolase [Sphingobium sp. WCS2017Hpa-17]|uniref:alpha/beta hydrolase n=1 Tax=Sphingobium sp. WCS2017Hpa-17 TaxID=3073638 RepID=UPI0028895398|nr:alpha/beta hydrolase [Sphingobium sp. WCS2017Hpa-17]